MSMYEKSFLVQFQMKEVLFRYD
ncbi:hypothetical protein EK904_000091, partial [Melospiza melodia maxima]